MAAAREWGAQEENVHPDFPGQTFLFESNAPSSEPSARGIDPEWYELVEEFLVESGELYPGIDDWWRNKVVPGLGKGSRHCRMISVDGKIAAVAISKWQRQSSKLCTLRVRPEFRSAGFGQELLHSTLASLLRAGTERVHFTISEEIQSQCGSFFDPYGFHLDYWSRGRYIRGMSELVYSAGSDAIEDALSHQIPLFGDNVVVLSVRPKYAAAIENGTKQVEFRKKFSARAASSQALVYVTSPVQEFRISASIADVIQDTPTAIWDRFGHVAGCSRLEFDQYFEGSDSAVALPLSNVQTLANPVHFKAPSLASVNFKPPQSFAILPQAHPVVRAVVGA